LRGIPSSAGLFAAGLLLASAVRAQSPTPAPAGLPEPQPTPAPAATVPTAQAPSPGTLAGERIIGIRVVGYQSVSPDTVAHYLGIKVGDPYDPEAIRARFHTLWDVGLLDNVTIEAEHDAQGVTLVVTVEERPTITALDFEGNKKITTSQIRDRLKEQKIEIRGGSPLSLKQLAQVRTAISDYYIEQGFRSVSVDFKVVDVSKTEKKVVFTIDEGDKI